MRRASSAPKEACRILGHWWSTPASTRRAPRPTSSSCASNPPKTKSGGGPTTVHLPAKASARCWPACRATCRAATSSCRTATPAPTGVPPAHPHHHPEGLAQPVRAHHVFRRSAATTLLQRHVPEFTVIAAPGFHGFADRGRHAHGDIHHHQFPRAAGDHRRLAATPARSRRPSSPC